MLGRKDEGTGRSGLGESWESEVGSPKSLQSWNRKENQRAIYFHGNVHTNKWVCLSGPDTLTRDLPRCPELQAPFSPVQPGPCPRNPPPSPLGGMSSPATTDGTQKTIPHRWPQKCPLPFAKICHLPGFLGVARPRGRVFGTSLLIACLQVWLALRASALETNTK